MHFSRAPEEAATGKLPKGVYYIGADESTSGTQQAKEMARLMGGKGKAVIMMGQLGDNATNLRTEGKRKSLVNILTLRSSRSRAATFSASKP